MPQSHQILFGGPQYAAPVLRPPSPTSSIGTEYGEDETALEERELSWQEFERRCNEKAGINKPRQDEELGSLEPLLLPRPKTAAEEKQLFEKVMGNLRERVRQLEEDELFEQTTLRGSQISQEQQPSTDNLDDILRSMMIGPASSHDHAATPGAQNHTPWGRILHEQPSAFLVNGGTDASQSTAGKRTTKPRIASSIRRAKTNA